MLEENDCWLGIHEIGSQEQLGTLEGLSGLLSYQKKGLELDEPGMVVQACNPSPWEAEAGGSQVQPELHREHLSQKTLKNKKEMSLFITLFFSLISKRSFQSHFIQGLIYFCYCMCFIFPSYFLITS
jgi:hypothetical protein